jgi:hypothetical protein
MNVCFLGPKPCKMPYSKMTIDEIYEHIAYDANLSITYNKHVVFAEEIAIVEFYWYLINWSRKFLAGDMIPFVYSSVEHIEPILIFSFLRNDDWEISSIWRKCAKPALIKTQTLRYEVSKLTSELISVLEIE